MKCIGLDVHTNNTATGLLSASGKEITGHMTKASDPMMRCILNRVTYVYIINSRSSFTAF